MHETAKTQRYLAEEIEPLKAKILASLQPQQPPTAPGMPPGTAPADGNMRPGMFANVTLTSPESKRTLWLPSSALSTSDLPQVLMVEDDAIIYRKVQIGRRDNGTIEIVSGLADGEQVIKDVSGLTRGLPVTIVG